MEVGAGRRRRTGRQPAARNRLDPAALHRRVEQRRGEAEGRRRTSAPAPPRGVCSGPRRHWQRGKVDGGRARLRTERCPEPPESRRSSGGCLRPSQGRCTSRFARRPADDPGRDISLHRSPSLPDAATTLLDGITLTTPARTIQDLRRTASLDEVRRALREAQFMRLDVSTCSGRDCELTRSRLERDFLRLCRRHRLIGPSQALCWRVRGGLRLARAKARRGNGRLAALTAALVIRSRPGQGR